VFETASWGRRILALIVDWVACILILLPFRNYGDPSFSPLTLAVFVVESALLTPLAGGSFGQLATRLRVVRADGSGRPIELLRALGRQLLVAAVIPPLVFKPDGRGLHDLVADSATVTLDEWRRQLGVGK
jgi:uncharacterized RDD family membrane protein YckC